jgi:SAM-dependent methyltransferase
LARYYDAHEVVYRRLEAEGHACWDKTAFDQFCMRPFLERALEFIGPPKSGARALDVGCGTGPISAVLVERGYTTLGIDVSETAVKLARARVPGATFAVQDALTMPGEGRFELIVDAHCLHCIVYDEHRRAFFETLRRLLAPGGSLVIDTMVRHPAVSFDDAKFWLDDDGTLWREYPEGNAEDLKRVGDRVFHPQRRILEADQVRAEVSSCGFAIVSDRVVKQDVPREPWALELIVR